MRGLDEEELEALLAAEEKPLYPWPSPKLHPLLSSHLRRRSTRISLSAFTLLISAFIIWSAFLAIFRPLYSTPPPHYITLRRQVESSEALGRGNLANKKIFIAANIVYADTVTGPWGSSVRQLIDILGPSNAFLSIYENDGGSEVSSALVEFGDSLPGNHSIVTDAHISLEDLQHMQITPGHSAVSRMEYLARVRNNALLPLNNHTSQPSGKGFAPANMDFDYVLFLNDVIFDPIDAAQLLFSTNEGKGYEAACAVDFVSVTNNYDSFASRDSNGFGLGFGPGFRIFPWFSAEDNAESRNTVLQGSDAVPVKSCWGGMVAFRADHLQGDDPIRFRAANEPYWDSSECCLIHADIAARTGRSYGIVQNPYIRVAYTQTTYDWIWIVGRFEHGLAPLQRLLTAITPFPARNERLTDEAGQLTTQHHYRNGTYITERRIASIGEFCGQRRMEIMKEDFLQANMRGDKSFDRFEAPPR